MSKKDKQLEKIIDGLLSFCIALFTAMCALIGFIFVNYSNFNKIENIAVFTALGIIFVAFCVCVIAWLKIIKKLGE